MSIQLQIALPLFVTVAALVGIAIWRKYLKPEAFISGITALAIAVSVLVIPTSTTVAENEDDGGISENDEISLVLAEQYMLNAQYEHALEIINELQQQNGDSETVALAAARCNLLNGNYSLAVQLYGQAGNVEQSELAAAQQLSAANQSDAALYKYITAMGGDPSEYGISEVNTAAGDYNAARDAIYAALQAHIDSSKEKFGKEVISATAAAAELIADFESYLAGTLDKDKYKTESDDENKPNSEISVDVDNYYSNYFGDDDDNYDTDDNDDNDSSDSSPSSPNPVVENALKKLRKVMASSSKLNSNTHLRLARLKGFVLAEDYTSIATSADRYVSAQELVIITELYINGTVTDSDFADTYIKLDPKKREELLDLCRETLEENEDSLSDSDYEKYENKVDSLAAQMDNAVAFTLRYDMLDKAHNGSPAMRSKVYLALAKLEYSQGNKALSDQYLDEALGTAGESDDDNYRIPMEHITGIVNGTADSSEIMNIAEYVDVALKYSLPLNVEADDIPSPETEPEKDFATDMTETVTQSTASLNIGVIDKSNFPEVKARVQIQSSQWETIDEIKSHLEVYDCGSKITDFTLEKIEFTTSRIILLCDMSGSMDGAIHSLRDAVRSFAQNMQEGEQVAVVGFSDAIEFSEQFSTDSSVVASHADKLYASGGTSIYTSLIHCGDIMPLDLTSNNIIIVMTDGQDGDYVGEADLVNNISKMASDKSLTVYTLGLGSGVDSEYLTLMAQSGNGSFLPVDSQESLDSFYTFIHGQLANQYILTYNAKNKTLNQRKLEIALTGESGSASKTYYLVDPENSNEGSDAYNPYPVIDTDLSVNGLSTHFIYKSSVNQTVKLRGAGFDAGDDITVRLVGNVKYNLAVKYIDDTTYELTIPADIAVGTYDLELSLRDSSITFDSELTVAVAGKETTVKFGSYSFTALDSYKNDNGATVLSGNVTMNGWLHFKGDLIITTNITNTDLVHISEIWFDDRHGAYVNFDEANAMGLASSLASSGVSLSFGALGRFYLTNGTYDAQSFESFPVDAIEIYEELNALTLYADDYSVSIYPDMLRIQDANVRFELPMQKLVLRSLGIENFEIDKEILITKNAVGLMGEFNYEADSIIDFTLISMPLTLKTFKVAANTLKGDYSLEAAVNMKSIPALDSFGMKFGVKDNRFDSIGFGADVQVRLMDAPVPISLSDFGYEVSGFSQYTSEKDAIQNLLETEISCKLDVNVASLNAYLPQIADLISEEDIALAKLDDCTLSLRLKNFRLAFEAKLVLCSVFEMGKCSITAGNFNYTNALIGYYNKEEFGLRAAVNVDRHYGMENVSLDVTGQSEIVVGKPYTGFWMNGNADFDVKYWIFSTGFDVTGDILVGLYQNSSGNLQFSMIVKGKDQSGNQAGFNLYITKANGLGVYTY